MQLSKCSVLSYTVATLIPGMGRVLIHLQQSRPAEHSWEQIPSPSGSSRCCCSPCGPWGWLYVVKVLVIREQLGIHFVLSILPSLTSLSSCSHRIALPHCTDQNQTWVSSDFQLSCLVNEQLGNNNLRDLLHLLYTSNKLFLSSKQNSCSAGAVRFQSTGAFPGVGETGGCSGIGRHLSAGRKSGLCASTVTVAGDQ